MGILIALLTGLTLGMILGAAIRWGTIVAEYRRRFLGDGPNVRIWWQ